MSLILVTLKFEIELNNNKNKRVSFKNVYTLEEYVNYIQFMFIRPNTPESMNSEGANL